MPPETEHETDDAKVKPRDEARDRDVDEIVQHTDSGSGTSQREHWPPNVDGGPA